MTWRAKRNDDEKAIGLFADCLLFRTARLNSDAITKRLLSTRFGQKRKTMPADGCAICVHVFVFRLVRLKSGALYT